MIDIHPDYIIDEKLNKKAVILSYKEWQTILEELEELDDIRAYDKAKSEDDETIPFDVAVQEIKDGKVK